MVKGCKYGEACNICSATFDNTLIAEVSKLTTILDGDFTSWGDCPLKLVNFCKETKFKLEKILEQEEKRCKCEIAKNGKIATSMKFVFHNLEKETIQYIMQICQAFGWTFSIDFALDREEVTVIDEEQELAYFIFEGMDYEGEPDNAEIEFEPGRTYWDEMAANP